ncbi:HNH endonuclease [Clostridium beijerinckii]|uniref:HNH endonuclease n=1 Tax=Clostridium beijerinckii TaxID=1520 RepID=UPI001494BD30|nr:HNH endonuclease signature motif containing protein [Clostridium beijerinckii]NOW08061.1 5-methylcytosine-specific restriction endonuclease McrA [Clostridium beijerinckii]NYC05663.1 5-methylcytosine-specific restriction endonuclease McrA [Clostridium beijerinckii]
MKQVNKFYKDPKWIAKRSRILKRDEYRCKECLRYGRSVAAATVHHVIPLDQRPDLKFNSDNLISLCNKCHDKMHDRTNNKLTKLGEQWIKRMKAKNKFQ